MKYTKGVLLMAAAASLIAGMQEGMRRTSTFTQPHQEPDNRSRRAEKDAAKLAKAEEKRRRRKAKRLAHNEHSSQAGDSVAGDCPSGARG